MDAQTLLNRMQGSGGDVDIQVVDVRLANEWDAGHLAASVHIPSDYLYEHLDELDRARPVVAVCRTGSRSGTAVDILQSEGFEAESLDGGLLSWLARGGELVDAAGREGQIVEPETPPDDRPAHVQALEGSFLEALFAVQEFFGDEEASEEDVRAFLRNRLIGEGRSPEEADRILDGG